MVITTGRAYPSSSLKLRIVTVISLQLVPVCLPTSTIMLSMLSRLILREESSAVGNELGVEWSSLPDVLTVLLLLGGDVVRASLAQLANGLFTPAVFSFGWVSYALTALLSAVGDNHLMPSSPDYPCLVINGETGYGRNNCSWVIGRMLRDFDYWKDKQVEEEEERLLSELRKKWVPLSVSFYDASGTKTAGVGDHDFIWFFSYFVVVVQLGMATVPCALYENWSILAVTIAGTAMAWVTAALPQWREEKANACRKKSKKTFVITRGNGTKDALVINGVGRGLDLEDLAGANARTEYLTRLVLCTLAILWIGLLITVSGIKQNTWYLLGVGGIGSLHNILVAGLPRKPGAYGIHLEYKRTIAKEKVMLTLQAIEQIQPMLGRSLLKTFFPGEMREDEDMWWADALARARGEHGSQV